MQGTVYRLDVKAFDVLDQVHAKRHALLSGAGSPSFIISLYEIFQFNALWQQICIVFSRKQTQNDSLSTCSWPENKQINKQTKNDK